MYDEDKDYRIKRFNYKIVDQGDVLNDLYMSTLNECLPRVRQLRYRKQVQYRIKEEWKVEKSVFADYIPDSQQLMDKLFESDWAMIMKPKFADGEEAKVKSELKRGYWVIRDAFKYYSSIASSTGTMTFALSLNSFTEYLKFARVFKEKTVSFTDTDTLFFTTNKRDKPTVLNPGNALIRHQFLEIAMRIAFKYSKQSHLGNSVKYFIEEVVDKSLKNGKSQEFRINRYWNEHCDNVLRHHMNLLKDVYENFSGGSTRPGETTFMSPGEFEKIFVQSYLINERFANRDIFVCFNLAMQAREDELTSDAHLKMTFVEFIEAISRAADYLSLAPPSDKVRDLYLHEIYSDVQAKEQTNKLKLEEEKDQELLKGEDEADETIMSLDDAEGADMTEFEHVNQPLHKKIEHMIPYLLAYCTKKPFKKKWKWPRKNPHTGFYTDIKEKSVKEVKTMMIKGMNRLIFSKLNLKEIVRKKGLNINLNKMDKTPK